MRPPEETPSVVVPGRLTEVLTAPDYGRKQIKEHRKLVREMTQQLMGLPAVQEQLLRDHFNELKWWRRFRLALRLARGRL